MLLSAPVERVRASRTQDYLVSVLLSAHVVKFSFFHMWDLKIYDRGILVVTFRLT